ncbi:MAG: aminoacyl-tRNA hydrolase, partial [Ktedonobacteraceae bacterium]|nr:aminoacyl-tRNA hydrolase [Ktedonobacteraceae bacterium]
ADRLAKQQEWTWERRGRAMLANGNIGSEKVVLIKPLTYMNNSGEVVGELVRWYKVQPEDILVVYDELDLPVGRVRLNSNGRAGGHNGMSSVIHHLHTNQFPRLRVGVGRPSNNRMETIDYVLGVPAGDERIELTTGEDRALEAIPLIIKQGIPTTMNLINADPEAQKKAEEKRRLQLERREQERLRRQAEQREQENQPIEGPVPGRPVP